MDPSCQDLVEKSEELEFPSVDLPQIRENVLCWEVLEEVKKQLDGKYHIQSWQLPLNVGLFEEEVGCKTIVHSFYGVLSFCITAKSSTSYSKKGILLNQFNEIKIWHQTQSFIKKILYTTLFDGNWLSEYIYGSSDSLSVLKLFIAISSFQTWKLLS